MKVKKHNTLKKVFGYSLYRKSEKEKFYGKIKRIEQLIQLKEGNVITNKKTNIGIDLNEIPNTTMTRQIGKTKYVITSYFNGSKDISEVIKHLAIKKAYEEMNNKELEKRGKIC